jgi:PX domain-containing protein kinase-like protein
VTVEQNGVSLSVQRRYTDFRQLHASITNGSGLELEFPGKKMTGNKDREFVAARQMALQAFLTNVVTHPSLRHALILKRFLNPLIYSSNFNGNCTVHVQCLYLKIKIKI